VIHDNPIRHAVDFFTKLPKMLSEFSVFFSLSQRSASFRIGKAQGDLEHAVVDHCSAVRAVQRDRDSVKLYGKTRDCADYHREDVHPTALIGDVFVTQL